MTSGLLAASAQAQAAPAPVGKIAHIAILGNKNVRTSAIRATLALKVGDPYSSRATEKARASVQGMGVFRSKVRVTARRDPAGGVDLTYTVAENPVFRGIRFTANTPSGEPSIPSADLIARMKTRPGQVINWRVLTDDFKSLFDHDTGYVAQQGRLVDASSVINTDSKTGVVTISLVEYRIQTISIQVTGSSLVSAADIMARMHTKSGDLYDRDTLEREMSSIDEMGGFKPIMNLTGHTTGPGRINITIQVVPLEAAQGVLDEARGKTVPFLYDPLTVPVPVIRVSVNGRPPLPFVVDTGTSAALSMEPWAAKELGLKLSGPVEKVGAIAYKRTPIQGIVLQGIDKSNNVALDPKEARVLDLNALTQFIQGQRVAGIVGLDMLRPVTTRFEFASRTLGVFAYSHPPLRVPGGTVLPLLLHPNDFFTVRATLAPNTSADLMLDTGSTSTQIPLTSVGALHPTATAYAGILVRIDGITICPELRLPSLTLGTLQVPDVVVSTLPSDSTTSLGLDILTGYRLTLDGPNGQLTLEPSARSGRYVQGWSGVNLKSTGNGWSVQTVQDGSPARLTGLQAGDEIVSVGGIRVRGLSQAEVSGMLDGLSGTAVLVSARRGVGKPFAVSWFPLDDFSAPRIVTDGLALEKANGGPWVVADVLKGSAGDRAGLVAGDRITRMGGEAVATMSLNRCEELMAGSTLLIEVERAGRAQPLTILLAVPPAKP